MHIAGQKQNNSYKKLKEGYNNGEKTEAAQMALKLFREAVEGVLNNR